MPLTGAGTPIIRVSTLRIDDLNDATMFSWLARLDQEERSRAAWFAFSHSRVKFVAARILARWAIASVMDVAPAALSFRTEMRGKPVAYLGDSPAPISFNLSHTDGLVGVAVGEGAGLAIGFDLERILRPGSLDFLRRVFTASERAWLDTVAAEDRPRETLTLWCLREAAVKATGEGLTADQKAFWFTLAPPTIHGRPSAALPRAASWFVDWRLIAGDFIAAIAVSPRSGTSQSCSPTVIWSIVAPLDLRFDTSTA